MSSIHITTVAGGATLNTKGISVAVYYGTVANVNDSLGLIERRMHD